jgi:hypothetical protein
MSTAQTASSAAPKITGGNKTPGKKFEIVPEDDYLLEIAWVEKTLSQKGKARLSFRFKVAAGPLTGRIVYEDCYLTEAAMWKVSNLAALCGYGEDDEIDPNNPADLINKFQKKTFKGVVKHEKFTGKDGKEGVATRVLWASPKDAKKAAPAETVEDKETAGDVPF